MPDESQSLPHPACPEPPCFPPAAPPSPPASPALPAAAAATQPLTARFAADMAAPTRFGADKFDVEARLIELGGTLAAAQELFKALERDFYRAAFGRYDE